MELKISSNDMLTILKDSGIDETDGKAIIFDIIQMQGAGAEERQKLIEERRKRELEKETPKKTRSFKTKAYEEEEEEEEDEEEEYEETSRPRRVNFSKFGGVGESLK